VRNGVLFPEKIGGRYLRLERPNRSRFDSGVTSGTTIVLAESEDLVRWTEVAPVMQGRPHYWDELIGSGPPPLKTRDGWLHVYHGIATHGAGGLIYQAGACLLDLDDPSRVLARGRDNILEPRELYETVGQVPNVVFPTGLVADVDDDGFAPPEHEARLYYGAADTVVATATTTVGGLLDACRGPGSAVT
jgi:beta-1,4-mannooligosaccharide/beta-1,4-mannosyl-N-acetylglucosamine phosphorylase